MKFIPDRAHTSQTPFRTPDSWWEGDFAAAMCTASQLPRYGVLAPDDGSDVSCSSRPSFYGYRLRGHLGAITPQANGHTGLPECGLNRLGFCYPGHSAVSRQWSTLRAWEGSQEKAFEELCCQLAAAEQLSDSWRFTRKAPPDAGIECFWTMPNGEEKAWQAKFFFQMQEAQWRDLDESVQTALNKHPRMVQYCVCLPIDLADARLTDKRTKKRKTFGQDAWNRRVEKWKQWAAGLGMQVRFEYWGNHQICNRLTKDEHRGRLLFWFNEQWFSDEWFRHRIEEAHKNAGKRYVPTLHVGLDLERAFDAMSRTNHFVQRLNDRLGNVRRDLDRLKIVHFGTTALQEVARELNQVVHEIASTHTLTQSTIEPLPLGELARLADCGGSLTLQLVAGLARQQSGAARANESYSYGRHYLYLLQDRFAELDRFVRSPEAIVANKGALLLVGEAGTGKTHMFCEIARRRVEAGAPTLLFLGEQFVPGEPLSQMLNILGIRCDSGEFLGALEAAAEARGTRALILLDAINEEHGREIWPKHLAGVLTRMTRHPRIGVGLSVRSSYEKSTIPEQIETDGTIVRFVHSGFEGHEEESVDRYFTHYGITLPSFPILDPEFSNPLFLRVLCESVQNRGLSRIPEGLGGFTTVFQFFLDSINEKLARPDLLDYDPRRPIVMQAVNCLVETMVAKQVDWLDRTVVSEILEMVLPRQGFHKSLFRFLVDEGVLSEELIRGRPPGGAPAGIASFPVIKFQYQKFADYLIVQHLFSPHVEAGRPEAALEAGGYLGRILADPVTSQRNQGIVEALAVLIPEKTGSELPALAPKCSSFDSVKNAVSASLVWRRAKSISPSTWSYIEQNVLPDANARRTLLRTLILVAPDPSHPYNALFLNEWLLPMQMADRDALWSTFLANEYAAGRACARLLRWTESVSNSALHGKRAITLAATALAWFLTSSNRPLRDRATKALVALLQHRLPLAGDLIMAFAAVNDPYILERVAAAAYGAAMRSRQEEDIAALASVCYETFFKHTPPPLNALSRDYLRGVIELALHLKPSMPVDVGRIRPPYGARLPEGFDPHQTEYRDLDRNSAQNLPPGLQSVHHSVTGGDFNSYVLLPLVTRFFASRLDEPLAPTRREVCERFEKGLSPKQAAAWGKYRVPPLAFAELGRLLQRRSGHDDDPVTDERPNISEVRDRFEATLTDEQKDSFRREVRPYVEEGYPADARDHVALAAVQRFILERVAAIGWRQELDDFDRSSVISSGRSEHNVERIGKKYQWIAFYDLISMLADNFQCAGDSYDSIGHYDGPWQITYGRNIDPSVLIRSKPSAPEGPCWWEPKVCDSWAEELDELAWLKLESDMPQVDEAFLIVKDSGQSEWVVLEGHYVWTQPTAAGREYFELPQRQIRYTVTSCVVRAKYASAVLKPLARLKLPRPYFLEARQISDPFLGEMHWARSYMSQLNSYYGYDEWTKDSLPHRVLVTTEKYYAEPGSFDASMDESITLVSPSHWITEKMRLEWNGVEGEWCRGSPRRTVFRDPSAHALGPTVLLASRKDIEQFLHEQGCALIWVVTGTKWVLGGDSLRSKPTGRRLMSGAIRIKRGSLSGDVRSWLELPRG